MGQNQADPLTTFPDGSQLVVSTRYSGDGRFQCTLYVSVARASEGFDLRAVSDFLEGSTCQQAQERAYRYARSHYLQAVDELRAPPYLIWPGPNPPMGPLYRNGKRSRW